MSSIAHFLRCKKSYFTGWGAKRIALEISSEVLRVIEKLASDTRTTREWINILKAVPADLEQREYHNGLCAYFRKIGVYGIRDMFPLWYHYSGDKCFPVPDPSNILLADQIWYLNDGYYTGPYGELRKDLAKFIVHELVGALEMIDKFKERG
jgi:hypothetical protein